MIREIISKRTAFSCSEEFLVNGKLTQDKQLIADKCNEYCTTVGSELANEMPFITEKPDDYLDGIYKNSMFLAPATTDEIRVIIEKFKNCSSGWDGNHGIKPNIIKQTYSGMIGPFIILIKDF